MLKWKYESETTHRIRRNGIRSVCSSNVVFVFVLFRTNDVVVGTLAFEVAVLSHVVYEVEAGALEWLEGATYISVGYRSSFFENFFFTLDKNNSSNGSNMVTQSRVDLEFVSLTWGWALACRGRTLNLAPAAPATPHTQLRCRGTVSILVDNPSLALQLSTRDIVPGGLKESEDPHRHLLMTKCGLFLTVPLSSW